LHQRHRSLPTAATAVWCATPRDVGEASALSPIRNIRTIETVQGLHDDDDDEQRITRSRRLQLSVCSGSICVGGGCSLSQ